MPKLLGTINKHLFLDQNWETLEALKELEGKRVEVSLKEWKNTRRNRQNRYYRGVVLPIALKAFNDNGIKIIDADEMHEVFKKAFWSREVEWGETTKQIVKSTTKMSVQEFVDFIYKIAEFLQDSYQVTIPEPSEQL
jgi:hypothetical protein